MKTKIIILCALLAVSVRAQSISPGELPNPKLTPGATFTNVTVEQLSIKGYANKFNGGVRHVPESEKRAVFIAYFGKVPAHPGDWEIDHLISLEIGGSNEQENLWPQPYHADWNARQKDRLENWLAASVRHCLKDKGHDAATALLRQYQTEVATDWIACYKKHIVEPALTPRANANKSAEKTVE